MRQPIFTCWLKIHPNESRQTCFISAFFSYILYSYFDNKNVLPVPDPRTNNWPLISSPLPGVTILAAYLYFTLSWGPRYMANRKPFKLEGILIAYNFIQVIVSAYIFYEVSVALSSIFFPYFRLKCVQVLCPETVLNRSVNWLGLFCVNWSRQLNLTFQMQNETSTGDRFSSLIIMNGICIIFVCEVRVNE